MKALFAALLLVLPCWATANEHALLLQLQNQPVQPVQLKPNPRTPGAPWIEVGVQSQSLALYDERGVPVRQFVISTASKGVGERVNSYQTPRGWHKVCERIGDGVARDTIIYRRQVTPWLYTPQLHAEYPNKDWILTRILWLSGCEPGRNRLGHVDTMRRYVYIHGSPDSTPMGCPGSIGCIRMHNADIVELFELVPPYTSVDISED